MSLPPPPPPALPPPGPGVEVPQWVKDEAALLIAASHGWGPPGGVANQHAGVAQDAYGGWAGAAEGTVADGTRTASWTRRGVALLVILTLAPVVQWFVGSRIDRVGPDRSGVVIEASASELPPPVSSAADRPTPGFEERGAPIGAVADPAAATLSTSFAYQQTQSGPGGETLPVTWSPCRPIHFVVNPAGAPADFAEQVVASVGAVSVASGLVFVDDGLTDEAASDTREGFQPGRYGDRWAPVIIQFAGQSEIPGLAGEVVGEANVLLTDDPFSRRTHFVSGAVRLDTDLLSDGDRGGAPAYVPVLRHELGHLVGLDHVDDPAQLMNPVLSSVVTYQAGDLAGLAQLGKGSCTAGL